VKTITLSYTFFELGLGGTPPAPKSKVVLWRRKVVLCNRWKPWCGAF
jgi:hypothetical protein